MSRVSPVPPAPGLQQVTGLPHSPTLRLRQEQEDEHREEGEEDREGKEGEVLQLRDEDEGEDEADEEVGGPVDEHHHGAGGRPGALGEHLARDHPGDGPGPNSEEHDEDERGGDHEGSNVEVLGDDDEDGHDAHTDQPEEVEDSPTQPVHERDGDERHPDHDGSHAEVSELRLVPGDPGRLEEGDGVVEDGDHPRQLLAGNYDIQTDSVVSLEPGAPT